MVVAKQTCQKVLSSVQSVYHYLSQRDALLGIVIQSIALVGTCFIAKLSISLSQLALPVESLFLIQSMLAFTVAHAVHTKTWWVAIHAAFPICVGIMLTLHLPNYLYLVLFILSFGIFWTTFQSQVPYYPSKRSLYPLLNALIPKHTPIQMLEIGSGLGGVSLDLAKRNPNSQFSGIEIAPIPWILSVVRAYISNRQVKFLLGSYYDMHFARYDIIYAYLSPAATSELWKKAITEMREGSLLISHEFPIDGISPTQVIENPSNHELTYLYKM